MKTIDVLKKIESSGLITEGEISLLKLRLNKGEKIDLQVIWDNEIAITAEQANKCFKWLWNEYKNPTGKERLNNPFGYREIDVLEDKNITFYFRGFYDSGSNGFYFHLPIYIVCGGNNSFEYYVSGGKIQIIG